MFVIRSLYVQNTIMIAAVLTVSGLLTRAFIKRKRKHVIVFLVWLYLVFWFFNSHLFGFSVVTVQPTGIKVDYGILSFRNDLLPLGSKWKVKTHMGGIRKNKRLYFLTIGDRQSMKVKGIDQHERLQAIGASIERMKKRVNARK